MAKQYKSGDPCPVCERPINGIEEKPEKLIEGTIWHVFITHYNPGNDQLYTQCKVDNEWVPKDNQVDPDQ